MHKLLMFFGLALLITGILSGIMSGGGGVVATELTSSVNATASVLPVESTTDYLGSDVVTLGAEQVYYGSKNSTAFLSCTRGYNDSTAASHLAGAMVYTATSSALNNIFGFNIVTMTETAGLLSIVVIPVTFFTVTVPHLIKLNINFLTGDLAIISYVFFIAGGMFAVLLAMQLATIAGMFFGR